MANEIVHQEGKYKIVKVGKGEEFSFKGNDGDVTLVNWDIQLEGVANWVKLVLKPDAPAPKEGDELEGHIEDTGKYGYKFVKKRGGGGFGGGKFGPGAAWANAVQTAATVVAAYYQISGTKPADSGEFLSRIESLAPKIKSMIDKFAGSDEKKEAKPDDKVDLNSKEGVVIEDVDEKELNW